MGNNELNSIILGYIKQIATEQEIDEQEVADFLANSFKRVYSKENPDTLIEVYIDLNTGEIISNRLFNVVEDNEDYDDLFEICVSDPKLKELDLKVGDVYSEKITLLDDFRRKTATQVLQSFKQKINEIKNTKIYNLYNDKIGTIILGKIEDYDKKNGVYLVKLSDGTIGYLPKIEQNQNEKLEIGTKYVFYLKDIKIQGSYWPILLSRKDNNLVNYYLKMEVPEVEEGIIKVERIARSVGFKTKIAVSSNIIESPAAICVGAGGSRVKALSTLLGNENIEIYNYDKDPFIFLINIFEKNRIIGFYTNDYNNLKLNSFESLTMIVPENYLSNIIGKKGINIKLTCELVGLKIDVKVPFELSNDELNYISINEIIAQTPNRIAAKEANAEKEDNDKNLFQEESLEEMSMEQLIDEHKE